MDLKSVLLKICVVSLLFLVVQTAIGQDLAEADTVKTATPEPESGEKVHSPKKATIYSAILPGLGQAYNKKYWKIPAIYIGFSTIGYFIDWNNDNYQLTKTAYNHLTDGDSETNDFLNLEGVEYYDLSSTTDSTSLVTALSNRQDYYRRNRDFLIISMVGFYAINIIDASVDAHLFNFNVNDDLTIKWQPTLFYFKNERVYCVNVTFNF